ncbi:MAG: hypothetical protein L0Y75_07720 [Acidobacteria bacterium]|nr:hypothetical protein [Acidobacteriota bacterium]
MSDKESIRNIVREIVRQALTESNLEAPDLEAPAGIPPSPQAYYAPWTGLEYQAHPCRQQFDVNEATINDSNLLEFIESKICSIEKNRACDHCGMCRTLGF